MKNRFLKCVALLYNGWVWLYANFVVILYSLVDDSVPGQNPFKMDFDLVGKNVKELNELAGEGEHVISHTTRGARLKVIYA